LTSVAFIEPEMSSVSTIVAPVFTVFSVRCGRANPTSKK